MTQAGKMGFDPASAACLLLVVGLLNVPAKQYTGAGHYRVRAGTGRPGVSIL